MRKSQVVSLPAVLFTRMRAHACTHTHTHTHTFWEIFFLRVLLPPPWEKYWSLILQLEKEMSAHSSILSWRILWMEEPGGRLSIGSHTVGHDWGDLAFMHALEKEMAIHSNILSWRIPGMEEPGGLPSMGSHGVGHDWSDLAAAAGNDLKVHPFVTVDKISFFLWLNNIPLWGVCVCIYKENFLICSFIDGHRLFPCLGYCK